MTKQTIYSLHRHSLAVVAFCFFLGMIVHNLPASAQEINFLDQSWEKVLAQAEATNQPILLYFHASWCQPCRRMERKVLSKKRVGKFYNKHFVSFSVDVDKDTGRRLAEEYGYNAVPAFLFLNPNAEVMDVTIGYQNRKPFIQAGKKALATHKSLPARYRAFQNGALSQDSIYHLAFMLHKINDDREKEVAKAYFQTLAPEDLHQKKNWEFFSTFTTSIDNRFYQHVLDNSQAFYKSHGQREVENVLSSIALDQVDKAGKKHDEELFQKILATLNRIDPSNKKLQPSEHRRYSLAQKRYYAMTEKWSKYAEAAKTYVDNHEFRLLNLHLKYAGTDAKYKETSKALTLGMTGDIVHEADTFYAHIDKEKDLAKATEWVSKTIHTIDTIKVLDITVPCDYHLTHAQLLSKQNRKAEAQDAAERAVKAADDESEKCRQKALLLLEE